MGTEKPYVLVVDDAPDEVTVMLSQLGETVGLKNSDAALLLLQKEQVDVLIVGASVNGGRGMELLARSADMSPLTCRIVMSDDSSASFLLKAINHARVTHCVAKPVQKEELESAIREALIARARSREALTHILLGKQQSHAERQTNESSRIRPQGWPDKLVEDLEVNDTERLAWFFEPDLHIGVAMMSPEDTSLDIRAWSAELELRLVTSLRETDHCFRVGERGFLVLFGHTSRSGCKSAGRRFGASLSGGMHLQTLQWPEDADERDPVSFAKLILSQT